MKANGVVRGYVRGGHYGAGESMVVGGTGVRNYINSHKFNTLELC